MKIAIILGTRPEIIRLSLIIKKCKENFDLLLIHTGQNWDHNLNDIFFEQLEIPKPNYFLDCNKGNLGENMGSIIHKTYDVLLKEKPDALLVLGDTNSCLSVISAKRLKIPIFHMEAGNRCFDFRVPEEINRKIVDHTSDINLCYTVNSKNYLINEGFTKDNVFVVGSPMPEIMEYYKDKIDKSEILEKLNIKQKKFFLFSIHREENLDLDNNLISIMNSINHICEIYNMPVIFSTHPRTKKKIDALNINLNNNKMIFSEPFGYFDYVQLIKNSYCFVSDSGTISEEVAWLETPGVTLRTSIERPEAVEAGNIIVSGLETDNIINSINFAVNSVMSSIPNDYTVLDTSSRVIKIILSYHHIVNKKVWFKS
ncbi:UDP-N-acetylglucosamine 2-epimerase [Catovirus CTV1]|uniref:UDP-N-acetylglucosamine 2-epimerase n=1 Tax=Catovirus CTV1 TaxID=1977631 RepID=A0A1V0SAI1_9VIRU|nr:UDP-N-acetylglucosamine 2-epimerase [Catovirus CTV1]